MLRRMLRRLRSSCKARTDCQPTGSAPLLGTVAEVAGEERPITQGTALFCAGPASATM